MYNLRFCTNCGDQLKDDDIFCADCGERVERKPIDTRKYVSRQTRSNQLRTSQEYSSPSLYRSYNPQNSFNKVNKYPSRTNDCLLLDRFIASCIDGCIISFGSCFFYFPSVLYSIFKDEINNGQSFSKSIMNLRAVNYYDNEPAGFTKSCMRNCCICCVCLVLIEKDQRHMGDLIAGTVVIRDR